METTLNSLKNQYAQDQGYEDWTELRKEFREKAVTFTEMTGHENAVCIRAQKALQEKTYESINADDVIKLEWGNIHKSITNPENLIR